MRRGPVVPRPEWSGLQWFMDGAKPGPILPVRKAVEMLAGMLPVIPTILRKGLS